MSLPSTHFSFLQSPPSLSPHQSQYPATTRDRSARKPRTIAHYSNNQTMSPPSSSCSLYDVLGLPMSASGHEIKLAYRRLARVCHPDVVTMNQKETSANEFKKIHTAYSTLSDPNKRASYDRDLCLQRWSYDSSSLRAATMAAASSAMSGFSGYTSKNWETDQCW